MSRIKYVIHILMYLCLKKAVLDFIRISKYIVNITFRHLKTIKI
jgi:hypothetical protein